MDKITRDNIPATIVDREGWVASRCPRADPQWDPNTDRGLADLKRYQRLFVKSVRAAAKRPTNLLKVRDTRQGKKESPDAFYERLVRAYQTYTTLDPSDAAAHPAIIMSFVSQCAPDIRRKLSKIEGFQDQSIQYLLQVARKVYDRRFVEEEEEEKEEDEEEDEEKEEDRKGKRKKDKGKKVKTLVAAQTGGHKPTGESGTQSEDESGTSEKILQVIQREFAQLKAQPSTAPPVTPQLPAPPPPAPANNPGYPARTLDPNECARCHRIGHWASSCDQPDTRRGRNQGRGRGRGGRGAGYQPWNQGYQQPAYGQPQPTYVFPQPAYGYQQPVAPMPPYAAAPPQAPSLVATPAAQPMPAPPTAPAPAAAQPYTYAAPPAQQVLAMTR